jgi:hypothetical protein
LIDLFAAHAASSAFQGIRDEPLDNRFGGGRNGVQTWVDTSSTLSLQEQRKIYIQFMDLHGSFMYLGTFLFFPLGFFFTKVCHIPLTSSSISQLDLDGSSLFQQ